MKNVEMDAFDALKEKEKTLEDVQKKDMEIEQLHQQLRVYRMELAEKEAQILARMEAAETEARSAKEAAIEANRVMVEGQREDALKCWREAQQAEDEAIMRMESVFDQHGALVDRVKKAEENSDTSDSEQEGEKYNPR